MKLIFFIAISLLFCSALFSENYAQTDFREGYVVKAMGDTLHGKIDYKRSKLLAIACVFKDSLGEEHTYKPDQILSYRFKQEKYFVSKKINEVWYFLEYLVQGKISLYYIENDKGGSYFIEKEGEKLIELAYEEGKKYIEDRYVNYKSTRHIGLLKYYMQDAPKLTDKINSLKIPAHSSLIKLTKKYHETVCHGEQCIIYQKNKSMTRISLEYVAGMMHLSNDDFLGTTKNATLFQTGVLAYFWTSRRNERIFIRAGLLYNPKINFESAYRYHVPFQIGYMAPRTKKNTSNGCYEYDFPHLYSGCNHKTNPKVEC